MGVSTDLLHEMLLIALSDDLHTGPHVSGTATILDVGTGTGTWACEFAARNPKSRVYGIDLHQVAPKVMPHNVVFETVDVMTGFPFNTGTFDFVHSRLLVGGITDWMLYLANLFRITKRGGYVECIEMELYLRSGTKASPTDYLKETHVWTKQMEATLKKLDLDPGASVSLKKRMEAAGFVDVQDKVLEIPIGVWQEDQREVGKKALEYCRVHMVDWFRDVLIAEGAERQQVISRAQAVMTEINNLDARAYLKWHFCSGTKSKE